MSLIGKAVAKSIGKNIIKKHGNSIINKLEDITKEAEDKLSKKNNKNYNKSNGFTNKELKRYKRLFILGLIIFIIVALLLFIDNQEQKKESSKDNEKEVINNIPTPTNIPSDKPITNTSTPTPIQEDKSEDNENINIDEKNEVKEIEQKKYKVSIHIDFKENVILNKYSVDLEIDNHKEILLHGHNADLEFLLSEGNYEVKFTARDKEKFTKTMKINVTSNMSVGYNLSCHSTEIQVEELYTNVLDDDGNILTDESLKKNFKYDIAFSKRNPYQGYYSTTYLLFDFDENKSMEFSSITSAKYGHKRISSHGTYPYTGDINKKVIIELYEGKKEEYIREDDKLIVYDEEGKITTEYHLCNIEIPMNILNKNS